MTPNRINVKSVKMRDKTIGKQVEFMPMILQAANRLKAGASSHVDYQDIVAAGFLGLVQAKSRFKRTRSRRRIVKLSTQAFPRIIGSIKDYLRKERIYSTRYEPVDVAEYVNQQRFDSGIEVELAHKELVKQLRYAVTRVLTSSQQEILKLAFYEGLSAVEIGREIHMAPNKVCALRDDALVVLREYMFRLNNGRGQMPWIR